MIVQGGSILELYDILEKRTELIKNTLTIKNTTTKEKYDTCTTKEKCDTCTTKENCDTNLTNDLSLNSKLKNFMKKTTNLSFLFIFDTKELREVPIGSTITCSWFSLNNGNIIYNALHDLYKNQLNEYYVVCPVYINKQTKEMLDCQLSITGKCHIKEHEKQAVIREIQEEIGITCEQENVVKIETTSIYRKEKLFMVNVTKSRKFDPNNDIVHTGNDDKHKKIQAVIYGKIYDLLKIYMDVFERPESDDIETIRYIRLISLAEFF